MRRTLSITLSLFTATALALVMAGCTASDPPGAIPTSAAAMTQSSASPKPSPSPTASATLSPEDGEAYDRQEIRNTLNEFSQGVDMGVIMRNAGAKEMLEADDSYLRTMVDPALSDADAHVVVENMGILMWDQRKREVKASRVEIKNDPTLTIPEEKITLDGNRATIRLEDMRVIPTATQLKESEWSGEDGSITLAKSTDQKWFVSKVTIGK